MILDFLDPEFIDDPYPAYRRLRDDHPVFWHPTLDCWVVSRFDDCRNVLADADVFASDYRRADIPTPDAAVSIQTTDPPEHTRVRTWLRDRLHACVDPAELERCLDAAVDAALSGQTGEFDLVSTVIRPVSVLLACRLLGADLDTDPQMHRCAEDIARSMAGDLDRQAVEAGLAARERLSRLIADRAADPRPGTLLDGALTGGLDAVGDRNLLVNSVRVTFMATISSAHRGAANVLNALLDAPAALRDEVARLRGPRLDKALHELLRFDPPIQAHEKLCLRPVRLSGQKISPGERVTVLIGAANRDERRFPDPDVLDLTRSPNPHLSFGWGPHTCLGPSLALILLRVLVRKLLAGGRLERTGRPVREPNPALRGFSRMPVRWQSARSVAVSA